MKTIGVVCGVALSTISLGCSKTDGPAHTQAAAVAPASAPAPAPAPAASPAPAPAPPVNEPKALGSGEGAISGTRVDVTELKRTSGGTLTLRFTIVNDSKTATLDVGAVQAMLDLFGGYTIANVHLIDPVGRKKYFTAKDAEGKCVCSAYAFVKPGERYNHWAKFPAPPDDVARLSIVIPTFAPVDDVPIAR
jgi:hypothetical protein